MQAFELLHKEGVFMQKQSYLIVGGGIIGLAVARELLLRGAAAVTVLEKEKKIAAHQTGHNSGVIHSGIYYRPGSEKAILCRRGILLLNEFCDRHGIVRQRKGKVVVAAHPREIPQLDRLKSWGEANGVEGLRLLDEPELKEREPEVQGVKALYVPDVSIVDYKRVAACLAQEVRELGGSIELMQRVRGILPDGSRTVVQTERGEWRCDFLINCAGLYSDEVARLAGARPPVRIIPFRGEYYELSPVWARKIRGLVYPAPDPRLPFLGVHLTPGLDGRVKVGPNAVLAFAREGYRWNRFALRENVAMMTTGAFWKMGMRYSFNGFQEWLEAMMKPLYARHVRKLVPGVTNGDLVKVPEDAGVRAQAVDRSGRLVQDFYYLRESRMMHVLNSPSPAATSSLAIAGRIADLAGATPEPVGTF